LQGLYPEASNAINLFKLYNWASQWGVINFPNELQKYDHIYDLMRVYNWRPGLHNTYPEAANGDDLSRLFAWAGQWGVINFPDPLAPHDPVYDLMRVYYLRSGLQGTYPQAANGVDLAALICWADWHIENLGVRANPILVPHASFYDSQC